MSEKIRKTLVTRTIVRKINTAPYETCDIGTTIQQEIEWTNNKELFDKSQALNKYVLADFEETFEFFRKEMNLNSVQGSTPPLDNVNISSEKDKKLEEFDALD